MIAHVLRWAPLIAIALGALAACSLLAPSDDELLGGSHHDAGTSGKGGKDASAGSGGQPGGTGGSTGGNTPGGTGGVVATGGVATGGVTSTGGVAGTTPSGGAAGTISSGGAAGTIGTGGASTGGTGGAGGKGFVTCGNDVCNVAQSYCCHSQMLATDACKANGTACFQGTQIHCDGTEDCPQSQVCCGTIDTFSQTYKTLTCASSCFGQNVRVVCSGDPSVCVAPLTCQQSTLLPGYQFCGT